MAIVANRRARTIRVDSVRGRVANYNEALKDSPPSEVAVLKVRSIPHYYRNVKRSTEILAVLSKYGLADWLSNSNIDFVKDRLSSRAGESIARLTREARIRLTLTALGSCFI